MSLVIVTDDHYASRSFVQSTVCQVNLHEPLCHGNSGGFRMNFVDSYAADYTGFWQINIFAFEHLNLFNNYPVSIDVFVLITIRLINSIMSVYSNPVSSVTIG